MHAPRLLPLNLSACCEQQDWIFLLLFVGWNAAEGAMPPQRGAGACPFFGQGRFGLCRPLRKPALSESGRALSRMDFSATPPIKGTASGGWQCPCAPAQPFAVGGAQIPLTVSIGATVAPACGHSESEILSVADLALYNAKSAGRNRSVVLLSHSESMLS
jgi:Diguanylate cyclase, GGDEF domain